MKIKIWHIILTVFVLFAIIIYVIIQPYMFWLVAMKQPFTPGHMNKYYIYSANTSIFNFQKEFIYEWIADDALFVVKDYDVALKYINECDKLNLKYKYLNTLRKFKLYMELKDYDNALKTAQINENFRNKFEMEVYCETGDYHKAKEAYKKYWDEYSKNRPKYKNNPLKYYYLAKVEYSGKNYGNANKALQEYFKNVKNSKYKAAWQLRADIAQKRNDKKDLELCNKKLIQLEEEFEKYASESVNGMYDEIVNTFKTSFF